MKKAPTKKLAVYQAKNGAIELSQDAEEQTIWANKKQISEIFGVDRTVISRHIKNIFKDKELEPKVVCAKFAYTTKHGAIKGKTQTTKTEFFNLDIILAVGYRTRSSIAIDFRKWATKTLRQHITRGFTLNPKRIRQNHKNFLKAVDEIKLLSQKDSQISTADTLELIKSFSYTWLSLKRYDFNTFPETGSKKSVKITTEDLEKDLEKLKENLIEKKQASNLFAKQTQEGRLEGIVGSVFQTIFGEDAYPTIEEKSANLLYFIVKNHPFVDGNKRSGAFAFVWFLLKAGIDFRTTLTQAALTTLTILVAESAPKEKDRIIGLVMLLLNQPE